jgi:hypothetical protein
LPRLKGQQQKQLKRKGGESLARTAITDKASLMEINRESGKLLRGRKFHRRGLRRILEGGRKLTMGGPGSGGRGNGRSGREGEVLVALIRRAERGGMAVAGSGCSFETGPLKSEVLKESLG